MTASERTCFLRGRRTWRADDERPARARLASHDTKGWAVVNRPASVIAADARLRDTGAHPAHPSFWARRGAGHGTLLAAAWLHVGAGVAAAASCALLWGRSATQQYPGGLALVGGAVAVVGLLVAVLSLPRASAPALIARTLLPAVDLDRKSVV